MHGYFIDLKLFKKVQSLADPFAYERHRKEMIQKKIQESQGSRISMNRKVPKVNKELFLQRLALDKKKAQEEEERKMEEEKEEEKEGKEEIGVGDKKGKKKKETASFLEDNRFSALFENPDFGIDVASEEFQKKFKKSSKPTETERGLRNVMADGMWEEEEEEEEEREEREREEREMARKEKEGRREREERAKGEFWRENEKSVRKVKMFQVRLLNHLSFLLLCSSFFLSLSLFPLSLSLSLPPSLSLSSSVSHFSLFLSRRFL